MPKGQPTAENNMSNQASVQDEFLQSLLTEETPASVYLVNGIRLSGHVISFDSYVVILQSVSGHQMIFKHAISTVVPNVGGRVPQPLLNAA
jgi:host factor-I protein